MKKSLITRMGEAIDQHRIERQRSQDESVPLPAGTPAQKRRKSFRIARWFLPNGGSILLVLLLVFTQSVWATAPQSPLATSTSTISYQGRLANAVGDPLTGVYNLEFRIYDVPTGGVPLWEELWTGGNSVQISDGLFNVMLGSLDPTLASAIEGFNELYLGITVGTDSEMSPRVQLGSVPFSMQAMTVPDGSVTTAKIADGAVTQVKLSSDVQLGKFIQNGVVNSGTGSGIRQVRVTFTEPFQGVPSVVATSDDLAGIYEKTFINVLSVDSTGFSIRWYKRNGGDFTSSDPSVDAYWIAVEP